MLIVLADAFLVFYAVWTVVEQLSYFLGLSFAQSWMLACSAGTMGIGVFFFLAGTESETTFFQANQQPLSAVSNNARDNATGIWTELRMTYLRRYTATKARITRFRNVGVSERISAFLKDAAEARPKTAWLRFKSMEAEKLWPLACWVCAMVAALLTICLHRPDIDDVVYLGNAVFALDSASVPIRSLKVLANGYVLTSYDFMRAAFSWMTGVPILVSYYILWPAFIAILVLVFQFRIFRLAGVANIVIASVVFFVVMLAWGDIHRTPANFGFVRLFQGKGPLIWLAIPAALYYWTQYIKSNATRPLVLLYCAIVAGVGFSPTGVLSGLLLIGMFVTATLVIGKFSRSCWPPAIAISLAGLYPLVIGLVMRYFFGYSSEGMHTADGIINSATNAEVITSTLLGKNARGTMALLAVLAAPLLLRGIASTLPLQVYFWICIALSLFPWTSEIFAKFGFMTFSWRWFYVLPFTLAMVIAVDRLAQLRWPLSARVSTVTLAVVVFCVSSSRWVLSPQNYTELRLPGFKLPNATETFLVQYNSIAKIEGVWLISPASERWL